MGRIVDCSKAVKMSVGGTEWYYQSFYDDSKAIDSVNLYDCNGDFVRTYIDFNDMIEDISGDNGADPKNRPYIAEVDEEFEDDDGERDFKQIAINRIKMLKGDMSIREFAEKVDLHYTTVYYYLNGVRFPTTAALIKIANSCGATVDWLLGRK